MKTALTIAGSDPTGGAGLQADLKVFQSLNVHGLSIPASLTAQNTQKVVSICPVEKDFFTRQIDTLLTDITPDALKTGMLYSTWVVDTIAEKIREYKLKNLVVDPVTVSSSGMSLAEPEILNAIRSKLFPVSRIITPNIYEASVLTGMSVETLQDMDKAARKLRDMGPEVVIITGGHLQNMAVDVLCDNTGTRKIESPKFDGEFHGTGCVYSAILTASLALGLNPYEAAIKAKVLIQEAIKNAYHPGKGMGILAMPSFKY